MKKNKSIVLALLLVIFLFSFSIRIINLAGVPPGLNRDEAAIGYTAYSLLEAGIDEYGSKWPVSFRSFGDWKLPLYIYLTIPFVRIFGLTEFATRLPSALFGSLTVVLVYFLIVKLFSSKNSSCIAFLAALFLAINPWHVYMSRNASESNIAVFLVTSSLVLFAYSFKKQWLLFFSFLTLSLTLYTYHGNHIFTPLLFIGILFFFRDKLKSNPWFIPACGIFLVSILLIYSKTLFVADRTKISGLFLLGDQFQVHDAIELRLNEHQGISIIDRVLHNKILFLTTTTINNYLRSFSPEFLFIKGGSNTQHNIPGFGNLYPWQSVLILIGLYWFTKEKKPWMLFLVYWLLISAVAPSITRDAPHTSRMMPLLPLPDIVVALGIGFVWEQVLQEKSKWIFVGVSGLIVMLYGAIFFDQYFVHFPHLAASVWGGGYKNLVGVLYKYEQSGKQIVMERPNESPYMYMLFYLRYDPQLFVQEVKRYPETSDGFAHVEAFGKYRFAKINWSTAQLTPGFIYIDWVEGVPHEATNSAVLLGEKERLLFAQYNEKMPVPIGTTVRSQLRDTIYGTDGKPQWYIIETSQQ